MSKAFHDNGCYNEGIDEAHSLIEDTLASLYASLLAQGFELNEILAMLTLAVCDVRTGIALDNKYRSEEAK
jgi:hypothetical protein